MTNSFYIKVISTSGVFYQGHVLNAIIPAFDGQKGIQAHHEDMVIAISDGPLRLQPVIDDKPGEWIEAVCGRGMAWIANNRVQLVVQTCEKPEDIDILRAQEAAERAKEQMRQKQSIQEYYHSQAAMSRAMARLKAVSGKSKDI